MLLQKNNLPLIAAIALIFFLMPAFPTAAGVINTTNFSVVYGPEDEKDARAVAQYAEDAYARISEGLGYESTSPVRRAPVRVYSSRRDFVTDTGIDRKKYIVGRAWSGTERIEVDASGAFARVERVVAHEITHVIIARILGPKVSALPLWANEGIARIQAGEVTTGDDDVVGEALSKDTFIPLKDISSTFPSDNEKASLAYSQGTSFMQYIQSKSGDDGLRRLLQNLAATGDFEASVEEVTGLTFAKLESRWRYSAVHGYDMGWLPRNLPTVVGITMALLCILAYLAIKRKKRWNAARWMIEDSYYDYEDKLDYGPPPE